MLLAESLGRKTLVGLMATGGVVWFLEATMFDSQDGPRHGPSAEATTAPPAIDDVVTFTATAYCTGTKTSAGVAPQRGVAAADPGVLPTGSIIEIDTGDAMLGGLYTVLDTGPNMKGRRLDLYTKSCTDAVRFGRRSVRIAVLRLGWSPAAPTSPRFVDRVFTTNRTWRQRPSSPLPSRPLPDVNLPIR